MSQEDKERKKAYMREKMLERQGEARVVRKIVSIIVLALTVIIAGTAIGGFIFVNSAVKPADPGNKEEKTVEIPIGSTIDGISRILEENGIIKNATVFKYYIKFRNEADFMAGEYSLSPSMTFQEIIDKLKTGKVMEEPVFVITIPEGKQLKEIAKIISEKTDHNEEELLAFLDSKEFIEKMMNQYPDLLTEEILKDNIKHPLEGYLFPATYSYYEENPSMEDLVVPMIDKTNDVLKDYMEAMNERGLTVHELVTMSSLIEEEATEKVDREKISGVFYNRLEEGMPLQTDPTVLYAHGEHKERVLYKDLEIDDPYNTYKYPGLTPEPIANAGVSSIEAALYPAETDDMYFLATPEGDVLFSKSLEEHNRKKAEHIQ